MLDTNVLIWWTTAPEKLSKKARNILEKQTEEEEVLVSSISILEVYILVKKNKLKLLIDTDVWLEKLDNLPYIKFAPIDNKIAARSVKLTGLDEADPADRIIVATAQQYGATLITSDKKILDYKQVQTIW